jgi:dihydrofolate synthase / folylpolyglutamate synthase
VNDERYRSTLDRLYRLRRFGMRPGLEVIEALLDSIDHPERSFRAVHIAGSKGKGSVAAMAAAILTASGRRTGLYTSPHLVSYRERIQIDRQPIPTADVVSGIDRLEAEAERLRRSGAIDRAPTFFEITTALAFHYFRAQAVEAAVVEVGLGGRLDATNVLAAPVGVVTTIELEHTEILGPTLTDIAREKAGILHRGMRGIIGEPKAEPRGEIERIADSRGVPLEHLGEELRFEDREIDAKGQRFRVVTPHRTVDRVRIPLAGEFQAGNAALAIDAADTWVRDVGGSLSDTAIRSGLAKVRWPGRLERLYKRPAVYLDVAHTPESARAIAQALAEIYPFAEPSENVVMFGCLAEKHVDGILEAFAPLATTLVAVPVRSSRSLPVSEVRRAAVGRFPRIVVAPDAAHGLALARAATGAEGFALVAGSDYLVGEILRSVEGGGEGEPDLSDPVSVPGGAPTGGGP